MEKKLTNSGPLREPADKHSIYTIKLSQKMTHLCSKERTREGFGLVRTPRFSLCPPPQLSSGGRHLGAIFHERDNAQGSVPVTMPRVWGSVAVPCAHAIGGVLLSGAASPGEGARAARACGQPRSSAYRFSAMSARPQACVTPPGERLPSRDRSSPGHRHA